MKYLIFASSGFPKYMWLMICAIPAITVFFIGISFWAAGRFGGSRIWVVGGLFFGGIVAARLFFPLLPVGVAVGAVIGCVASILVATLER